LGSGVTTVCSMGAHDNLDLELRDMISGGHIRGPRLLAAGSPIAAFTGGQWQHKQALLEVTGADEARRAARQQIKAGVDHLLLYAEWDKGSLPWAPPSDQPSLDEDEIRAAVQEAHHASVPCCALALSPPLIRACARAGVQWMDRALDLDSETIDLLARQGTAIVPTLFAQGLAAAHEPTEPRLPVKALRAGVLVATGTATNNRHCQLPAECEALVQAGFTPYQALQAATVQGARALGRQRDLGTLQRGRWADIVILDANPLPDIANLTRVRGVLKAGQVHFWRKEV
jgi:imidazolonepropionase-like amidohydrolase